MSASLLPVFLCLFSAITVATTSLFVKRGGDVLATRMIVSLTMAASVLPVLPFVPLPSRPVWFALGLSLLAHGIYQFAMVRALQRGDLSLVFPVMRGLAPLLTAFLASFILGEQLNHWGWGGLALATAALFVFATPEKDHSNIHQLRQNALIWAIATALGVALYSVADANGIRLASELLTYIVWLFCLDWIGISIAAYYARRERLWSSIRPRLRDGIIGGILGSASYASALWAFTLTDAAKVTALRETSVVFGAMFGAILLKEPFGRKRIIAALVLASGLILLETAQ